MIFPSSFLLLPLSLSLVFSFSFLLEGERGSLFYLPPFPDINKWRKRRKRRVRIINYTGWAHLLVIAPMSANLLAKVTAGLCDNLLTNVIRVWDTTITTVTTATSSPSSSSAAATIIVAPSMNDRMFTHPLTAKQLATLDEWKWFEVLPAQVKLLACGDVGQGGMCEWSEIVRVIEKRLALFRLVGNENALKEEAA